VIDKFVSSKFKVTTHNVKFAFRIMNKYFESENKNIVSIDDLWEYIKLKGKRTLKGWISSKNKFKSTLINLENKGKIMIGNNDVIYPM